MSELSPAAQAVSEAAWAAYWHELEEIRHAGAGPELIAAAVIRAAADQVVPGDGSRRANEIRSEFLAIADELEAQ